MCTTPPGRPATPDNGETPRGAERAERVVDLGSFIALRGLPQDDATALVRAASLPNRDYTTWLSRRRGPAPPATLTAARTETIDGVEWLLVPHGLVRPCDRHVDRRSRAEAPLRPFVEGFELRPYQTAAVDAALQHRRGLLVAPCGAGKTAMLIGILARCGRRALVVVPTIDLARQMVERIDQALGLRATVIGDGAFDDSGDVVVALPQSLVKVPWVERQAWGRQFGAVLVDETHRAACASLLDVLSSLSAELVVGVTATPERADGLSPFIGWTIGPMLHRVDVGDLQAEGRVLAPLVRVVPTGWSPPRWAEEPHERADALANDAGRNALILELVRKRLDAGRRVLVLVDRVEHAQRLAEMLGGVALVGKLSSSARAEILRRVAEGEVRCVVGTSLADEGLDVPVLDTAVLAAPCGILGRVEQRAGRVTRPHPGKPRPEVLDLVDAHPVAEAYARRRAGLWRRLGWPVVAERQAVTA